MATVLVLVLFLGTIIYTTHALPRRHRHLCLRNGEDFIEIYTVEKIPKQTNQPPIYGYDDILDPHRKISEPSEKLIPLRPDSASLELINKPEYYYDYSESSESRPSKYSSDESTSKEEGKPPRPYTPFILRPRKPSIKVPYEYPQHRKSSKETVESSDSSSTSQSSESSESDETPSDESSESSETTAELDESTSSSDESNESESDDTPSDESSESSKTTEESDESTSSSEESNESESDDTPSDESSESSKTTEESDESNSSSDESNESESDETPSDASSESSKTTEESDESNSSSDESNESESDETLSDESSESSKTAEEPDESTSSSEESNESESDDTPSDESSESSKTTEESDESNSSSEDEPSGGIPSGRYEPNLIELLEELQRPTQQSGLSAEERGLPKGLEELTEENSIQKSKPGFPLDPLLTRYTICRLPPEKGLCKAYITQFYYDPRDGHCKQFTYGGCLGNPNRFDTYYECSYYCSGIHGSQIGCHDQKPKKLKIPLIDEKITSYKPLLKIPICFD